MLLFLHFYVKAILHFYVLRKLLLNSTYFFFQTLITNPEQNIKLNPKLIDPYLKFIIYMNFDPIFLFIMFLFLLFTLEPYPVQTNNKILRILFIAKLL